MGTFVPPSREVGNMMCADKLQQLGDFACMGAHFVRSNVWDIHQQEVMMMYALAIMFDAKHKNRLPQYANRLLEGMVCLIKELDAELKDDE